MNSLIIASNVIKRLFKEIQFINFLILFPILAGVLTLVMFGKPSVLEIGVSNSLDNDLGIISYIEEGDKYNINLLEERETEKRVKDKTLDLGLIFPNDFTKGNLENKVKLIALKDKPEYQELRGIIENYIGATLSGKGVNDIEDNKGSNEQPKVAIGMMTMFIIMFVGNGMALLLEDKKLKTFTRTFAAPLKGYEMVLGQLIANTLLGAVQISIFLFFTTFVFKIDWGVSIINIFVILFVYLIAAIGFAIGLAGFIKDSEKYNMVLMVISVATSFLGGSFFPLEYVNETIQKLSNFMPQKWVNEAFSQLANGASLIDIQTNLVILILFGVVLFTFGVKTLKPTVEDL